MSVGQFGSNSSSVDAARANLHEAHGERFIDKMLRGVHLDSCCVGTAGIAALSGS